MAYMNVKDWKNEQVIDWIKGLDDAVVQYTTAFLNNGVMGHQLLDMRADYLEHVGVRTVGHQELILEAIELLRNVHYELDKENLQMLALRLACAANSLYKELLLVNDDCKMVHTQFMADVHNIVTSIKALVFWLDRSPFMGDKDYVDRKCWFLNLGIRIATYAHRDIFSERPVPSIRDICLKLTKMANFVIQKINDPMILQPATLGLVPLKRKDWRGEWGFNILASNHSIHQISEIKEGSAAHNTRKINVGDEIVQVNFQTIVGWQRKNVMLLLQECHSPILLTLKKRPRHMQFLMQIYMKPYRLPSKRREDDGYPWSRFKEYVVPTPRLFELPPLILPRRFTLPVEPEVVETEEITSDENSSDEISCDSQVDGGRVYPVKPRPILQRRNTITGLTPTDKRPYISLDEYFDLINPSPSATHSSCYYIACRNLVEESNFLRDKSASCHTGLDLNPRPTTVIGLTQSPVHYREKVPSKKSVKFEESGSSEAETEAKEKRISIISLSSLSNEDIRFIDDGRELTDRTNMTSDSQEDIVVVVGTKDKQLLPETSQSIERSSSNETLKDPNLAAVHIQSIIKKFDGQEASTSSQQYVLRPKILPRQQSKTPPEVPQKPEGSSSKPVPPPRSSTTTTTRGRISKSQSTPAYDLTEEEHQFLVQKPIEKSAPIADAESVSEYDLSPQSSDQLDPSTSEPSTSSEATTMETIVQVHQSGNFDEVPPKPPPRTFGVDIAKPAYPADSPKPNLAETSKNAMGRTESLAQAVFEFPEIKPQDAQHSCDSAAKSMKPAEQSAAAKLFTDDKPPKHFEPKVVSTPITKSKMDFADTDLYKGSPATYEVQKSTSDSKVSPTNSIVKGLISGKNKAVKKKNTLIGKRRKVTVNDLSPADIQGFLYQRLRGKHNQNVHWEKRWFVLLGNCLYGFKTKEDPRAACLIFLSGFTVAVASEVKSRSNAFKVYHTGTVFYFSADDPDALQSWIELIKAATLHNDPTRNPDSSLYSETDESDTEKTKPVLPEKSDSFKKFGSLKKFSSSKNKDATASGSTSLDRKWFFKSSGQSKSVPVPTAQFRSYRKVRAPDVNTSVTTGNFTSHVSLFAPNNLAQSQNVSVPNLTVDNISKNADVLSNPVKVSNKPKPFNYVHASNPSLCNVNEFNVPSFKKPFKHRNESLDGFVTLEELMIRQTEERKLNPHHIIEEMANNLKLIKPHVVYGEVPFRPREQPNEEKPETLHSTKISHSRSASGPQKASEKHDSSSSCFGKRLGSLKKSHKVDEFEGRTATYPKAARGFDHKLNRSLPRTHKMQDHYRQVDEFSLSQYSSDRSLPPIFKERSYEMIHCQETVNDVQFAQNRTLDDRMYQDVPKKLHKLKKQHSFSSADKKSLKTDSLKYGGKIVEPCGAVKLKSAVSYTPMSLPLSQDAKSKPKFAFELSLDEKSVKSSKMKQIFSKQSDGKKEKTFLGSPKLSKAFFKSQTTGSDLGWPSNVSTHTTSQSTYSLEGVSLASSEPFSLSSPTVDYPDMEYPPVFEPETYSLADPQSSLSILRKQGKGNP